MAYFDIVLLGGDKRIAYMAPCLRRKGYCVNCYGTVGEDEVAATSLRQVVESAKVIVGGIPFTQGAMLEAKKPLADLNLAELSLSLQSGQILMAGVIPENFRSLCEEKKVRWYDFMKEETIAVFNTIATAEGAIREALSLKETNIHGSRTLILGYGRCGKILADKLKGLSASVTVCGRNRQELSLAAAMGMKTLELCRLDREIYQFEYIYNTIPAVVLDKSLLKKMRKEVLVLDIASDPGGVDYLCASELKIKAFHILGLPGKYAAMASAESLSNFVDEKIRLEGL